MSKSKLVQQQLTTFITTAVLILLVTASASCVRIPGHHSTVGKYTELHDINTECPQEKNIVPTYAAAIPLQVDELNSQGFVGILLPSQILDWNSLPFPFFP